MLPGEAAKDRGLDLLCILAFAFDPQVLNSDEEYIAAEREFRRSWNAVPRRLLSKWCGSWRWGWGWRGRLAG